MNEEEKRKYVFAQLSSLPNAFQYVEVTNYIEKLEKKLADYKERNEKAVKLINKLINRCRYEEDFCEEDIELEKILEILDKKEGKQ